MQFHESREKGQTATSNQPTGNNEQEQRINMASSQHTLPSPDISDVMSLLCAMKKQNEDILAKNEEILTKLNSIEEDNRKPRQELLEIKSSQKHNSDTVTVSRKRDQSEDETEYRNEHSDTNKRARVTEASLPEPPASFDTLDDDCLGNVLDFVGKSCYSAFGRVNKRCHEMFCSKGFRKETYLYGYGPLRLIIQQSEYYHLQISKAVFHYNRRDILEWRLTDESIRGYKRLKCLCDEAIEESRLDILREVFQRANEEQLEYLRDCDKEPDLCYVAAQRGKLECLKLLRENGCEWDKWTWYRAKQNGHEHILEYLRDNDYPNEWQVESDSD